MRCPRSNGISERKKSSTGAAQEATEDKRDKNQAQLTNYEIDHDDIGNYKDEHEKMYFAGNIKTHDGIKCK
eukprot:2746632-Ditylum_brightwellii.AAC.1